MSGFKSTLDKIYKELEFVQKGKLKSTGGIACSKELSRLYVVLDHAVESFYPTKNEKKEKKSNEAKISPKQEIIRTIQSIISDIDHEEATLEKEFNGVKNYSSFTHEQVMNFEFKRLLREELKKYLIILEESEEVTE